MGLLQVDGTIDRSQFWPSGTSDGDTARVQIERVTYEGKRTRILDRAQVRGRVRKSVIDARGEITVRFQGIDAPELHYTPSISKTNRKKPNGNFRQHYGREAARKLGSFLQTLGPDVLKCRVVTEVDSPNDVFDTYGRFIGDIIVNGARTTDIDLNLWMLENGLAFPTFYASMSPAEITKLTDAATAAKKRRRGLWAANNSTLSFDGTLLYSDRPESSDPGAVILPKLFRRLSVGWVANGNTKLHTFLVTKKISDRCYKTRELLDHGLTVAPQYDLADFVTDTKAMFDPAELVFLEAPSALYDRENRKITRW